MTERALAGEPVDPTSTAALAAARLRDVAGPADVAVVLGSGWAPAAEIIGPATAEVAFGDLPGFPPARVSGHAGVVRVAAVGPLRVLVLVGRAHLYEGHPVATVVHPVRMAVEAGCGVVVLTNAAGGLRPDVAPGTAVLISDHINLTGSNPLLGGPNFLDLSEVYSARLRAVARQVDPDLPEGVYAGLLGPTYETPAEIRMLRAMGADLVGMSTVLEAIAARHLGAEVLGVSLVTNLAAGLQATLDHAEVLAAGRDAADRVGRLLRGVLERLARSLSS